MRTINRVLLVALGLGLAPTGVTADVASDRAAAIVVFPRVDFVDVVLEDEAGADRVRFAIDTTIQLSNTSNEPVRALCFYVSAVGRCSLSDAACLGPFDCPLAADLCVPQWIETDFDVVLTPRQPLAWVASRGLPRELLPLDGVAFVGPTGDSNAGTAVPPVQIEPLIPTPDITNLLSGSVFRGELRCIAVDASGRGIPRNVLKGEATVMSQVEVDDPSDLPSDDFFLFLPTGAKYNAIGIQAIEGDANGDGVLELGGGSNEYNGCSQVLIAQHFFDFAFPTPGPPVFSDLTLVPCTADYRSQAPGSTNVQFLVFNEFEQRFSTSVRFDCFFNEFLSDIDTNQDVRSIWSVFVAGTVAGQTRIRGVQSGLLGVLGEEHFGEGLTVDSFIHLGLQGDRAEADRMTLPR